MTDDAKDQYLGDVLVSDTDHMEWLCFDYEKRSQQTLLAPFRGLSFARREGGTVAR
ncbi:hypothetical protein [Sphingomonas sp. UYEF23]|uniref:hypothetical protein n=1 Tax=Sphingomonas sp. UYEF23 TaxID=1756408 RepID=UPI0033934BD1